MTIDEIIRALQAENKETESRKVKLTTEVRSTLDKKDATQEELDSADKKADEIRQLSEKIEKNNKKIKNYQVVARGDNDSEGNEPKAGKPPVKRNYMVKTMNYAMQLMLIYTVRGLPVMD